MTDDNPIISAEDVKKLIDERQPLAVIDARGGADAYARYKAGHLEGALFVDLEFDLSAKKADPADGGRHPLPSPQNFGELAGNAGITPDTRVLVYDDKSGANAAARFWWMMKAAGHNRIQVIDGGIDQLRTAGARIVEGDSPITKREKPYPVEHWALPIVDIEDVDRMRTLRDFRVIDVRETYRYSGESEPIDLVAGHIPGAVSIPYSGNLQPDGSFRPAEELAAFYRSAIGDLPGEKVVVHCGSGVTACHTILALTAAGIPGARLYVGSWSEWSRNTKPLATGPNP
jgi:thiosulfate/3-mercaptopyruvate sulfurtransferase